LPSSSATLFLAPEPSARRSRLAAPLWLLGAAVLGLGAAGGYAVHALRPGHQAPARAVAAPITVPRAEVRFNFHMGPVPIPGTLNSLKAQLRPDFDHLSRTHGRVQANLAALATGIELRDEHARNYLGAGLHPDAVFTLTRFIGPERILDGQTVRGQVRGRLTLNGVTRPLSSPVRLKRSGQRLDVLTRFKVTLADHHIQIPGAEARVNTQVRFSVVR
jgi:polyisoprenoid-binding protein YceI